MSLETLLGIAAVQPKATLPIPEAQIATLREAMARYAAPCPFVPGDLVTPREGYGYTDAGLPHIVLEVLAEPMVIEQLNERVRPTTARRRRPRRKPRSRRSPAARRHRSPATTARPTPSARPSARTSPTSFTE